LSDVLARGKRENFRVNIIEAFDQPWKRTLEGTVGGHWGLLDDAAREQKFSWGGAVSNHPYWRWQASGGLLLAALVFTAALIARRRELATAAWLAIALDAAVAGVLVPWTAETMAVESLGVGGWLRSLAFAFLAIAAPLAGAAALAMPMPVPAFAQILGSKADRVRDPLARTLGFLLLALAVMALQASLALAFDPRYRDFPFAPLTAAAVPFVLLNARAPFPAGPRAMAETVAGIVLCLCAIFVVWNETIANWQALWFGAALALVAVSLFQARAARG
jgi:hypothetical protein